MSPILSFCMAGRDDDYTPDFRYRLETTLDFLAGAIRESGHRDKVEVVIADWGGERPLRDVVSLTKEACEIARFVTIPRQTILELQGGKDYFSTAQATNVAIRRASGAYRALCGTDILIPRHTVDILIDALESGAEIDGIRPDAALMFCTRKQIPWDVVARQPSVIQWQRFLHTNAWMLDKDNCFAPGFLSGNASVIMMHAALWNEFGGLCESMTGWGWSDVELTLRVNAFYPWLDMSGLGAEVFDLAHQSGGDRRSEALKNPNRYEVNRGPQVNGPSWGLGDLDLDISAAVPRAATQRRRRNTDAAETLARAGRHVREKLTTMLRNGRWLFDLYTDDEEVFLAVVSVVAAEMSPPSVIVDVGASSAVPAAAILSLHRWAEYLAVDSWLGSCAGIGHPTKLGYLLYSTLVGFMGRGNFVANPESLPVFLGRAGFPAVDLVVFREAVFKEETLAEAVFRSLCDMLSPDGLIVVRHQKGRRRFLGSLSGEILVREVQGLDVSVVVRRHSVAAAAVAGQAESICALSSAILRGLPEHPVRRLWRSLGSSESYPGAGRCVLVPRGSYGREAVAFVTRMPEEGPHVVAVLDENSLGSASSTVVTVVLPASLNCVAFDSVIIMADSDVEMVRIMCDTVWGPGCRTIDFGGMLQALKDQRFLAPFLERIVDAPPDRTLVVCGYGVYGRALVEYLKSHNADRFRCENIVVWDNLKDKRELTSMGFRWYSPDEHDEWPASYLFAVTPLNNEGMVAQLMALLTRHLVKTCRTRLVVGGLAGNRSRALRILAAQPDVIAGRVELLAWAEGADEDSLDSPDVPTWTPDGGRFPSGNTVVFLPSVSTSEMAEHLERLGGQRGESFIDNVLWD